MNKIFSFSSLKIFLVIGAMLYSDLFFSQNDSTILSYRSDSIKMKMNLDAIYNRPFLSVGKLPVALGGYVEANTNYEGTDGVNEGLSFQIPRLTLFVSSVIKRRLKFLSEIEFEEGGKEISIEFASMDLELNPLFNLRGGIIMNPIGAFNQNHDGPRWEFINRPLSATTIIPSTWSNVGFGIFGKYSVQNFVWAYEFYATNGFDESIIDNPQGRTWLPAAKQNRDRFEESSNGIPLFTAKTALKHRKIGELGISWMGGVYNQFKLDGLTIDKQRRVDLIALDFNTTLPLIKTNVNAEWVKATVDVPDTYSQQFGTVLQGGFIDVVQPVYRTSLLGWSKCTFNIACRAEYVDYNKGTFRETNGNIGDHVYALVPGVSFRPSSLTVIRFNYRREWRTDLLGNPPSNYGAIQFGFSTYF